MSFEIDVTKPVGSFTLRTPSGPLVYDVMAITREPLEVFKRISESPSDDPADMAVEIIEAVSSVLVAQNGAPPPREMFDQLWLDGYLGLNHLRQIAEYVQKTAVGDPPA